MVQLKPPKPVKIEWYAHDIMNGDNVLAYTQDGGRLFLKTGKVDEKDKSRGRIYADCYGRIFAVNKNGMKQITKWKLTDKKLPYNMKPYLPPKPGRIFMYVRDLFNEDAIILSLDNGDELILHTGNVKPECATRGLLYADTYGRFYTLTRRGLNQINDRHPSYKEIRKSKNGISGSHYLQLTNFHNLKCHLFVATVFLGPRPVFPDGKVAQCDHLNGDKCNNSVQNLEWVHPDVNSWRYHHVLKVLRRHDIDPAKFSGEDMHIWFEIMQKLEKNCTNHYRILTRDDYIRCFEMEKDGVNIDYTKFITSAIKK